MTILRNVIFKSAAFNTTEPKDYFINECCFGDDVARWLTQELRSRGVHTEPEPGQEDFGWYVTFRIGEAEYDFVIGYRPGEDEQLGDWMCTIERRAGLIGSVFGARKREIPVEAAQAIHGVLSTSPQIMDLLWFTDQDYAREENGRSAPTTC